MVTKKIIAHEFGHAVCACLFDNKILPESLELYKTGTNLAACNYDSVEFRGLTTNTSKLIGIIGLGGIFGELIYVGSWEPWGSRYDIDEFLIENKQNKHCSDLYDELYDWMYVDDDYNSFRSFTSVKDWKIRRGLSIDFSDTAIRLPNLWEVFLEFCKGIEKREFTKVVDEIYKNKEEFIDKESLGKYVERVLI